MILKGAIISARKVHIIMQKSDQSHATYFMSPLLTIYIYLPVSLRIRL